MNWIAFILGVNFLGAALLAGKADARYYPCLIISMIWFAATMLLDALKNRGDA